MSFERGFLQKPAVKALLATWPAPPMDLPRRESHPCGRCGQPAACFDRSLASGAVAFICYACDPRGHLTLVAPAEGGR